MLSHFSEELSYIIENSLFYLPYLLYALGLIWFINLINWLLLGKRLNILGIMPRHIIGLPGIFCSPILHANFNHLFFNCIPLFCLSLFILTEGLNAFIIITFIIVLLNGSAIWLIGRPGVHIGASGLIAGYFGYVLASAYEHPTFSSIFLTGIALYYFGGILFSVLPLEEKVSWEGHLTGIFAGIITLLLIEFHSDKIIQIINWLS